jgi:hypothetical protein
MGEEKINKIDENNIEIEKTIKQKFNKGFLLEEKKDLEKEIIRINEILVYFIYFFFSHFLPPF